MARTHCFVVFHETLHDELYNEIPQDILDKHFTFVAVNPSIPKHYTQGKYHIINEWELPIYDPSFQERGYNENSVIYHVYANNLHSPYTHIGFLQYDMRIHQEMIDVLQFPEDNTYYALLMHNMHQIIDSFGSNDTICSYILQDYKEFFKKPFNINKYFPLLNTFIVSVEFYETTMMPWITQLYTKLYPWCIESPNPSHHGRIGGIYERISGFVLGASDMKCKLLQMIHDNSYKCHVRS